jgi:hypothetical protein
MQILTGLYCDASMLGYCHRGPWGWRFVEAFDTAGFTSNRSTDFFYMPSVPKPPFALTNYKQNQLATSSYGAPLQRGLYIEIEYVVVLESVYTSTTNTFIQCCNTKCINV